MIKGQFMHFDEKNSCCFMINLPFAFNKYNPITKAGDSGLKTAFVISVQGPRWPFRRGPGGKGCSSDPSEEGTGGPAGPCAMSTKWLREQTEGLGCLRKYLE